jgi:hypothetical protein
MSHQCSRFKENEKTATERDEHLMQQQSKVTQEA